MHCIDVKPGLDVNNNWFLVHLKCINWTNKSLNSTVIFYWNVDHMCGFIEYQDGHKMILCAKSPVAVGAINTCQQVWQTRHTYSPTHTHTHARKCLLNVTQSSWKMIFLHCMNKMYSFKRKLNVNTFYVQCAYQSFHWLFEWWHMIQIKKNKNIFSVSSNFIKILWTPESHSRRHHLKMHQWRNLK